MERVIWLTGISGAGKSTLAAALRERMLRLGSSPYIVDGDVLRAGLCSDLGFSAEDKKEQARRAAELARIVSSLGMPVIVALISPYGESRTKARGICSDASWFEVYVRCSVSECRRRDPKGLYARFDAGEISGMAGLDAPYEEPSSPDMTVDTGQHSIDDCVEDILKALIWEDCSG